MFLIKAPWNFSHHERVLCNLLGGLEWTALKTTPHEWWMGIIGWKQPFSHDPEECSFLFPRIFSEVQPGSQSSDQLLSTTCWPFSLCCSHPSLWDCFLSAVVPQQTNFTLLRFYLRVAWWGILSPPAEPDQEILDKEKSWIAMNCN